MFGCDCSPSFWNGPKAPKRKNYFSQSSEHLAVGCTKVSQREHHLHCPVQEVGLGLGWLQFPPYSSAWLGFGSLSEHSQELSLWFSLGEASLLS